MVALRANDRAVPALKKFTPSESMCQVLPNRLDTPIRTVFCFLAPEALTCLVI